MLRAGFRNCSRFRDVITARSWKRLSSGSGMSKLEGKVALITGAASGIGRETARKFVENGAKVIVADIQREQGEATARQLGSDATFVLCDVMKESDISAAVDFAVGKHGRLDVMYNNAGIACHTPPSIADLDLETFDRVTAINVRGTVAGVKHAARVMIPRKQGVILCTASITGVIGGLAQFTYSLSKASVIGIVKSAVPEMSRNGIRINCISPMVIATPLVMDELKKMYPGADQELLVQMLRDTSSLKGAVCEPSDVANAAVYLASDDAKYVTGHNLVVDGGMSSFKNLNLPTPDHLTKW